MRRALGAALALCVATACTAGESVVARVPHPEATVGGTLTIGVPALRAIDPAHAADRWSRFASSLICDPLIQLDPVTGELVPALAESWIVSASGMQVTLKLREDVRFHDGSALTADDVVASLTRAASQEEASAVADLLEPVAGWAKVHGDEEARNEEETARLQGVNAIGTHAVQIALVAPRADFVRVLAHPVAAPVSRAAVAADPAGFETRPVCAGPYRVAQPWRRGDPALTLVRHEGYHASNLGFTRGGRGYADRIVLRTGARAADVRPAREGTVTGGTPYLDYVALPVTTPPFDRREVRLALSRAIDREALSRAVSGGARAPAHGVLPPALGRVHRPNACGASTTSDAAGARRLLGDALAGLTLSYNPDADNAALARAVAASWERALGITVTLRSVPFERLLATATSTGGAGAPFRMGWEPPYPGADAMLAPLFSSGSIGTDNLSRFADPRFERELERRARRATVDEDLRGSYQRLEDIVCEQMPVIPLLFGGARYAFAPRVGSAVERRTDLVWGTPIARELYLRR